MKIWCLFLSVYAAACLLAACGAEGGAPTPPPLEEPDPAEITEQFRLVEEDDGVLLLAKQGGSGGDVYTLSVESGETWEAGTLVEVRHSGMILESYPAQFANVTSVTALPDGFDDLCGLYLDVLEDLWDVDEGLNADLTELGVDLSETRLPAAEQSAVAWAFGQEHGVHPVQGTWETLVEQGYITGEPLGGDAPAEAKRWQWESGILFSIREEPAQSSDASEVTFEAEKWRSVLGAYFFVDCTATQNARGAWGDYRIGSEAIA